jgi:hypothetical protein
MAKRSTQNAEPLNVNPDQPDAAASQRHSGGAGDAKPFVVEGAQAGRDRAWNKNPRPRVRRKTEPAAAAYEGSLSTRTPRSDGQGITPRSSEEENARQKRVVKDRPDAQAGVNHAK